MISKFIELCDVAPTIPYDRSIYISFHRGENDSVPTKEIKGDEFSNELIKCISATDDDENTLNGNSLSILKKNLTYFWVINGDDSAKKAIDILSALNGIIGSKIKCYKGLGDPLWEKAISLLKGYIKNDYSLCEQLFPDVEVDRAKAMLNLEKYGLRVVFENDTIILNGEDKLYEMLVSRVSNMGGIWFIERILSELPYNEEFGRLVIFKEGNMPNPRLRPNKKTPYNYMINVGLKMLSSKGYSYFQHDKYFNDTVKFFREICFACFEIQNYSIWADIFHKNKDTLGYLRDLVFHESIFDLHQSTPRFIVRFISFIAKKEKHNASGVVINEFLKFIKNILQQSNSHRFVEFKSGKANKNGRKSPIQLFISRSSKIISDFNCGFLSPTDYECVDFWNYPLIKLSDNRLLILPRTIAARCCYEAFMAFMRDIDKNIDSKIGGLIEEFMISEFKKAQIDIICGNYSFAINRDGKKCKISGECDGLIESSNEILLFEFKKKSLVRKSRGGSEADILLDLGGSLLDSQVQCLRTELALRKGPLFLTKNDGSYNINLNNRNVSRISVIIFPFGNLQDRLLIDQILSIFCRARFEYGIDDESKLPEEELNEYHNLRERIAKLGNKQDRLVSYLNDLKLDHPFFNSWFLDIEKIMYLLKDVSGPDDFCKKLNSIKFVSFCTYDIYNEILLQRIMNQDN